MMLLRPPCRIPTPRPQAVPRGGFSGRVLVTSRSAGPDGSSSVALGCFEPKEAQDFLRGAVGEGGAVDARIR